MKSLQLGQGMGDTLNTYSDPDAVAASIKAGTHRAFVGGLWDQIGTHQFAFLKRNGLRPNNNVLDVGCGCLRVGVHLADYLDPGCYYGIDLSEDLINVGYEVELAGCGLCPKVPRTNLHCTDTFDASGFNVRFDMVFAQSVFTHLPLNQLKLALGQLADVTSDGGRLYATFFLVPKGGNWADPQPIPNLPWHSFADRDPFHYTPADIEFCTQGLPWRCRIIGDWGHARGQSMVEFLKIRP